MNLTLKNIYAYDIASDSTWTDTARDYAQKYVMNLIAATYGNIDNISFVNVSGHFENFTCRYKTRFGLMGLFSNNNLTKLLPICPVAPVTIYFINTSLFYRIP